MEKKFRASRDKIGPKKIFRASREKKPENFGRFGTVPGGGGPPLGRLNALEKLGRFWKNLKLGGVQANFCN